MLDIQRKDTIIAISTAAGAGAIAMLRLSGPEAVSLVDQAFQPSGGRKKRLRESSTHTLRFGTIVDEGNILDEVLVSVFRKPRSFTGEDMAEISCHGSMFIQQKLLEYFIRKGARLAQPGEFTLRAFLTGKLDLSQAEAVADLIAAESISAHRLAMNQLRGGYSNQITDLREKLINLASLIELELDFAEEDVEFASRPELEKTVDSLIQLIDKLVNSFELGNVLKNGIPVVIAGQPNVGKSTLLNALLNEERAIVSDVAGTTRDTIEEEIVLAGVKFRFIDTAGIRETGDAIEKIGVERTWEKIRQSPVILFIFDVNDTTASSLQGKLEALKRELKPGFRIIPIANKIDGHDLKVLKEEFREVPSIIFISAKQQTNLFSITSELTSLIEEEKLLTGNTIVTNVRHLDALQKTAASLLRVREGIDTKQSSDLIAIDLRHALHYLGEITGQISNEDLLTNIFSKFCIGK